MPMDVIVPTDIIPKPPSQGLDMFQKLQRKQLKRLKWSPAISQKELQTLPFILMGLNNLNYFPSLLPPEVFGSVLKQTHPQMKFYSSKFTGKIIGARIVTMDSIHTPNQGILPSAINNINLLPSYEYNEVPLE